MKKYPRIHLPKGYSTRFEFGYFYVYDPFNHNTNIWGKTRYLATKAFLFYQKKQRQHRRVIDILNHPNPKWMLKGIHST